MGGGPLGGMVNLYVPRRQNGGASISAGDLTFTLVLSNTYDIVRCLT